VRSHTFLLALHPWLYQQNNVVSFDSDKFKWFIRSFYIGLCVELITIASGL